MKAKRLPQENIVLEVTENLHEVIWAKIASGVKKFIKRFIEDLFTEEVTYFFGDRIKEHSELLDKVFPLGEKEGKHPTIIGEGVHSILNVMPRVVKHLRCLGIDIFCCNPRSLLVKDEICEYRPVIE